MAIRMPIIYDYRLLWITSTEFNGALSMIHAMTIDVEDYYNVIARDRLGDDAPPTEAVVVCTKQVLGLLGDHDVMATFFVLGEVAERFPELIREIAGAGHELGVHGYRHRQVFKLSREQFAREISDTRKLLEDISGIAVHGHRAPAFSIRPDTRWALEVVAESGFSYDGSIFPISGRRYGWPGFRTDIHEMTLPGGAKLIEAPASAVRVMGKMLPACGGGYLRHFPYWFTRWAMRRIGRLRPAIVYTHPYEMDTSPAPEGFVQALAKADRATQRFHKVQLRNRDTVRGKLDALLKEFEFAPLGEVISCVMSGCERVDDSTVPQGLDMDRRC